MRELIRWLSLSDRVSDGNNGGVPRRCVPVLVVGDGDEECDRFVVRVEALRHPSLLPLLEMAAQEFGYKQEGILRVPCTVHQFRQALTTAAVSKNYCETTLPYAHTLLAPSNAVEERVCISVLVALAVVVLVVASALAGSSRMERVVAADVVADMLPLAETARSQGRDAGVLERTSGAADDEMGFLSADGFPGATPCSSAAHWVPFPAQELDERCMKRN